MVGSERGGRSKHKAFLMGGVGGGEDVSASRVARLGERVMHVGRRMQSEPTVVMFGVAQKRLFRK